MGEGAERNIRVAFSMTLQATAEHPRTLDHLPSLLTVALVAQALHVCDRTPRRWIAEGRLRAVRTARGGSGRVLIRKSDLIAFLGLGEA